MYVFLANMLIECLFCVNFGMLPSLAPGVTATLALGVFPTYVGPTSLLHRRPKAVETIYVS